MKQDLLVRNYMIIFINFVPVQIIQVLDGNNFAVWLQGIIKDWHFNTVPFILFYFMKELLQATTAKLKDFPVFIFTFSLYLYHPVEWLCSN
jgi:hypothetical protein